MGSEMCIRDRSFFAYQTILNTGTFIILEESQSARVFGGMADDIAEKNPQKALGWLTQQYEQLVSVCENWWILNTRKYPFCYGDRVY